MIEPIVMIGAERSSAGQADREAKGLSVSDGSATSARLAWIDNLRVLLTILVILLHLAIGYGAAGDWYYDEPGTVSTVSEVLLTLFVAINQAFFMGFFFMISSYVASASLARKGPAAYLRDRFRRLGIPILLYAFVVNPLFVAFLIARDQGGGYWGLLRGRYFDYVAVGPTWFLEALLLMSIGYVIWNRLRPPTGAGAHPWSPSNGALASLALALGLASFVVRIWLPVGWWLEPIHFQLAHFPQYVTLFALGVAASHRGWFQAMTPAQGRLWSRVAIGLVVAFPVLFAAGGALDRVLDPFLGGWHWQQFAYSLWEQAMCVALVVSLLVLFRRRVSDQGRVARAMSGASYATYVFHAPVITLLAIGLSGIGLDMGLKFILVAPVAVSASFAVGYLVKRLPAARGIF